MKKSGSARPPRPARATTRRSVVPPQAPDSGQLVGHSRREKSGNCNCTAAFVGLSFDGLPLAGHKDNAEEAPWPGRPPPSSRSASVSRSTATSRPSSDRQGSSPEPPRTDHSVRPRRGGKVSSRSDGNAVSLSFSLPPSDDCDAAPGGSPSRSTSVFVFVVGANLFRQPAPRFQFRC